MELNISNIQHFSVGDGEGIRTTVFFKGCNLCCPWCHNPENLSFAPVELCFEGRDAETFGKKVSAEDLLPELLEDADFFAQSGGGVTLSGGEVLLQSEGAAVLARALKEEGVAILIDTAGCVPYAAFERLNPWVQGYLFDFKTGDAACYRQIGGDLALVMENIRHLLADGMKVQVRIPLIPGFNTDHAAIELICARLQGLGVEQVELLPFHRLGSAKYRALGLDYAYKEQEPLSKEALTQIKKLYLKHFKVTIER